MFKQLNQGLVNWLQQQGAGEVAAVTAQSGGSINAAFVLTTQSGQRFFLKQNRDAPDDMFQSEAQALQLLAGSRTLPVPDPYYWSAECLLMELIAPGPKSNGYWARFGEQLATMHRCTRDNFGLEFQTYCGTTPQQNQYQRDGYQFFATQRLLPLGNMSLSSGYFQPEDLTALEKLCERLPQLVPGQPASLIHGDLWAGNAHTNAAGDPVLIDPALYFGWREAEIAMTQLFGGFPEAFYAAYQQTWPLEQGWRDRCDLYNLFHLLNHLNLFGLGYLAQTQRVLQKYG